MVYTGFCFVQNSVQTGLTIYVHKIEVFKLKKKKKNYSQNYRRACFVSSSLAKGYDSGPPSGESRIVAIG